MVFASLYILACFSILSWDGVLISFVGMGKSYISKSDSTGFKLYYDGLVEAYILVLTQIILPAVAIHNHNEIYSSCLPYRSY
jgi:hypothetical protein